MMLDILAKRPINAEGWLELGLAQLQQGDHDAARTCFALAAAADASLVPVLNSTAVMLRQGARPGDDDFLMGVVRLPPWVSASLSGADQGEDGSIEGSLKRMLACLTCQNSAVAANDEFNEDELAKGILFALRRLMEQRGSLDLGNLADGVSDIVGEALDALKSFKTAVAERNFSIAFQPIVGISSGAIHHYEALCRFGPDNVSPFKAITFAEQAGLVHEFDLAMAEKVVERLAAVLRAGEDVTVAVNVSGHSIGIPSYLDGLLALLRRNPWTKGRLMFEITESARMAELETAAEFIQALRSLGHQVCLDDFGAGAASFQYLSMLDVDVVKIDGSAITNARSTEKARALLSALSDWCRRIGVETVAEMVEDAACLEFCRACGCDYVQGYLFGRPGPDIAAFRPLPNRQLFTGT